jgi:hypothetical protein
MKMRLSQPELLGSAAVLVYIVFFSLNPPVAIRSALSTPTGLAVAFGGSLLVMLYQSKIVGGLLILALLLTMTKVTEHLDNPVTGTGSTTGSTSGTTGSTTGSTSGTTGSTTGSTSGTTGSSSGTTGGTSGSTTGSTSGTTGSTSTAAAAASRQEAAGSPPIPQSTGSAAANPPSSAPPASTGTPKPVMSCNIENFASF